MQDAFIGIDVSKNQIDVAFLVDDNVFSKTFSNSRKGYEGIISMIQKQNINVKNICMEATGRYSDGVAEFFFNQSFPVSVANPLQVKRYGQSVLARNKTDKADAQVIARFAKANKPNPWMPIPPDRKALSNLVRQLDHLKTQLTRETNRLEEEKDTAIQQSITRAVGFLKKEIKDLQISVKGKIDKDPDLMKNKELLESIPGIGKETISCILANIDVTQFDSAKKLSAFCGLSPQQHQSGSSVRGKTKLSKIGDKRLRKALYMPAVVAKKCNPVIKAFYERLVARGMHKRAAVCACMRKLLHIMYGVLKSQKPFSLNLVQSQKN